MRQILLSIECASVRMYISTFDSVGFVLVCGLFEWSRGVISDQSQPMGRLTKYFPKTNYSTS